MSNQWQQRKRPSRLERRYEFPDYPALRDFLDRAAELSERDGLYPDIGFGRDYANLTIYADDDADEVSEAQGRFAQQLDDLYPGDGSR